MKNTRIMGNGTSRFIRAPADMPETFGEWRDQLVDGTATVDIQLNEAGCFEVGMRLGKETMLTDETAGALDLKQDDPSPNDAFYALNKKAESSGVNLLDNWYFADPIDQREKTKYTGSGYTVDRWRSTSAGLTVSLLSDGIRLAASESGHGYFRQYLEDPLPAGTYTYSALVRGSGSGFVDIASYVTGSAGIFGPSAPFDAPGQSWVLVSNTFTVAGDTFQQCYFRCNAGKTFDIMAVKLEPGDRQTLAHQDASGNWVLNDPPPNKALELAKCRRFFKRMIFGGGQCVGTFAGYVSSSTTSLEFRLCDHTFRANPSVVVSNYSIVLRGTNGYSGDATSDTPLTKATFVPHWNTPDPSSIGMMIYKTDKSAWENMKNNTPIAVAFRAGIIDISADL